MFNTARLTRVDGKEAYTPDPKNNFEIVFVESDITFLDSSGVQAVANASMNFAGKLTSGSFIARKGIVYRVSAINRGAVGDSTYLLTEVGRL